MADQFAKQIKSHMSQLIWLLAILIALSGLTVTIIIGHREWDKQTELTQAFESCMQIAPFKNSFQANSAKATLNPENLEKHFDEFNQIFDRTGLPPIWNGKKLVPWKEYHKESIQIAERCHEKLGIKQPQKELRGTYAKPVWDPKSSIWLPEEASA